MKPEINKYVELVQILLFLSDMQDQTQQALSNKSYCSSIKEYFFSFKNHKAVRLTRQMIREESFIHIRPLRSILELYAIAEDCNNPKHEWAISVIQFMNDTDFDAFFESQSAYYNWIIKNISECEFDTWIEFINAYFRVKSHSLKLYICPFAGNYGFTVDCVAYVVRCMPYYDKTGSPDWQFDWFAKGIAHEYAHCFVNPIIEANKEVLSTCKSFFLKHNNIPSCYNVDYAVMNEYWVRAFTIRFMEVNKHLFPKFDIQAEYERQRESFLFIDNFVDMLKIFESSAFTFEEFYLQIGSEICRLN